jgi:hypothetical protein
VTQIYGDISFAAAAAIRIASAATALYYQLSSICNIILFKSYGVILFDTKIITHRNYSRTKKLN